MTSIPFVALLRAPSAAASVAGPILFAAGATVVLDWDVPADRAGLTDGPAPDETPVVLIDLLTDEIDPDRLADDVSVALTALTQHQDDVIATVRPVTDTLKLVDAEGVVTGTAERDGHRFVGSPIALPLRRLRGLGRPEGAPVAFLSDLVAGGAVVRSGDRL